MRGMTTTPLESLGRGFKSRTPYPDAAPEQGRRACAVIRSRMNRSENVIASMPGMRRLRCILDACFFLTSATVMRS